MILDLQFKDNNLACTYAIFNIYPSLIISSMVSDNSLKAELPFIHSCLFMNQEGQLYINSQISW